MSDSTHFIDLDVSRALTAQQKMVQGFNEIGAAGNRISSSIEPIKQQFDKIEQSISGVGKAFGTISASDRLNSKIADLKKINDEMEKLRDFNKITLGNVSDKSFKDAIAGVEELNRKVKEMDKVFNSLASKLQSIPKHQFDFSSVEDYKQKIASLEQMLVALNTFQVHMHPVDFKNMESSVLEATAKYKKALDDMLNGTQAHVQQLSNSLRTIPKDMDLAIQKAQSGFSSGMLSGMGKYQNTGSIVSKVEEAKVSLTGLGLVIKRVFEYGLVYRFQNALLSLPGQFYDINVAMERMRTTYEGIFQGGASNEFAYAIKAANDYGKSIESVAESYKKFAVTSEFLGMSQKSTRDIFESITQAMTKVGGSSSDVQNAFRAVEQMLSKGSVSAEEFRRQFAQYIPGAMKMGADAVGKTTAEFMKMMKNGELISTEFLPKFSSQLSAFAVGWENAANTIEANSERLKNNLSLLFESTGFQEGTKNTISWLNSVVAAMNKVQTMANKNTKNAEFENKGLIAKGTFDKGDTFDYAGYDKWMEMWEKSTAEQKVRSLSDALTELEKKQKEIESHLTVGVNEEWVNNMNNIQSNRTNIIKLQAPIVEADIKKVTTALKELQDLPKNGEPFDFKVNEEKANWYIDYLKKELPTAIQNAQALAKAGIDIEANTQKVENAKALLTEVTSKPWYAMLVVEADTSQLDAAIAKFDKFLSTIGAGKVKVAEELVKTGENALQGVQAKIANLVNDGVVDNSKTKEYNDLLQKQLEIKEGIEQANSNVVKYNKEAAKENAAQRAVNDKYGSMPTPHSKFGDYSKENKAYMDMQAGNATAFNRYMQQGQTVEAAKQYADTLKGLEKNYSDYVDQLNKKSGGGHKEERHAIAVDKLAESMDNLLAKEFSLANQDPLGAAFSSIDEKANSLSARVKQLALDGGLSIEEMSSKIAKFKEMAYNVAVDKELEKIFPWLKKDNEIVSIWKLLTSEWKRTEAEMAKMGVSGQDAIDMLLKMSDAATKARQEAELLARTNASANFGDYVKNASDLEVAKNATGGSNEKAAIKELGDFYLSTTKAMRDSRLKMYQTIAEQAKAYGMSEAQAAAFVQAKWEESEEQRLQMLQKYGSASEAFSAKLSLSLGLYKSAATVAREDAIDMAQSVSNAVDSVSSGIGQTIGDLIRNIGNGTASIEDLWKNMLSRMLDMFASFVEDILSKQVKKMLAGMFSDSITDATSGSLSSITSSISGSSNGQTPESSWKSIGKSIGGSLMDSFSSDSASGLTDVISNAFSKAGSASSAATGGIGSITGGLTTAASGVGTAMSVLGTVGSTLGVVGAVAGVVGGLVSLFGEKKEEIKKTASGYNVGYNAGHATSYGVDFYSDGSVTPTGASDPAVQKKIADSFRETAESLQDFAEELGFAVNVLEGFSMPNMNITEDQLDSYIANGENMMAFKGLMEAGLRGAFDSVARDGEVYKDEYERLATSLSTVKGSLGAYGYELADVAQITQDQIDALRTKNTEVAEGTADAMRAMATSMGATGDVLAQITSDSTHAAEALEVTDEQLSNILEADYASDLLDAVGGEDAFSAMMGNLTKNVFNTVSALAENLDYYTEKANTSISKLGESGVTIDNFWTKFDQAIKDGLTVDEFEAWGKASTWVNQINTVTEAMEDWNNSMTKVSQSLDARTLTASGLDYQATLAQQLAAAEWELYDARKANYDEAVLSRIQEVQSLELAATKRKHEEEYQDATLDAQSRIYSALDDDMGAIEIAKARNAKEYADYEKQFTHAPGNDDTLFKNLETAYTLEINNMMKAITDAIEEAVKNLNNDLDVREAVLADNNDVAEAIRMSNAAITELNQAYEDGVDSDTIARLIAVQNAEMEKYIISIDSTLKSTQETLEELLASLLDQMNELIDSQITLYQKEQQDAQTLADAYYAASESIYTTLTNWAIDDSGKTPNETFDNAQRVFDSVYAKAMGGDSESFTALSNYGSVLRTAGQNKFGTYDEYQSFYRDLQEKMGLAAAKSEQLGNTKTDAAKLYEIQADLYELLKTELAKDDPNTSLLATLGNTMSLVQEGIDNGTTAQEAIRSITESPTGTGGYRAIIEALGKGDSSISASILTMVESQTSLMALLEEYLNASNKSSLETKTQLAYQQYQQSADQEVATFRNSPLGNIIAQLAQSNYANPSQGVSQEQGLLQALFNQVYYGEAAGTGITTLEYLSYAPESSKRIADQVSWMNQNYGTSSGSPDWESMYSMLTEQNITNWSGGRHQGLGSLTYGDWMLPSSIYSQKETTAGYYSKYLELQRQLEELSLSESSITTLADATSFGAKNGVATETVTTNSDLLSAMRDLKEEMSSLRKDSENDNSKLILLEQKMVRVLEKIDTDGITIKAEQ